MTNLAIASKNSHVAEENLNRFYTRNIIGDLLTNQLQGLKPKKVLDLGVGEGSLSIAVAKRWNDVEITSVDIDPQCEAELHKNILESGAQSHLHYLHDVLDPKLPEVFDNEKFDLAVCNPPFYKLKWNNSYAKILQDADMLGACPTPADATAELLFLAQNLRLIKNEGTLALIVPDGMLTGWRTMALRQFLISKHGVNCVVQLPKHSFHDTEARCFILILTKNSKPKEHIKLLKYDAAKGLLAPLYITTTQAKHRLDYEYHSSKKNPDEQSSTLRQLGADIKRGSLSSIEARSVSFPIFHTSDYSSTSGLISLSSSLDKDIEDRYITVKEGDILIARVDRKLHHKVAMVVSGKAALTDCVYRMRLPQDLQEPVFKALRSPEGAEKLLAASKGVSARLLGKADLLDVSLDIKSSDQLF